MRRARCREEARERYDDREEKSKELLALYMVISDFASTTWTRLLTAGYSVDACRRGSRKVRRNFFSAGWLYLLGPVG